MENLLIYLEKKFFGDPRALQLGEKMLRASHDINCNSGEPKIGWTSTCEEPYAEPLKPEREIGRLCDDWKIKC